MAETHKCFALFCEKEVPLNQGMCRTHWFKVPKPLRDTIWQTTGLERSKAWIEAKRIVNEQIREETSIG
jgi:hypothetical protein